MALRKPDPMVVPREELLMKIRDIEDGLAVVIERIAGGTISTQSALFGLREIRSRLKKLTDVPDADPGKSD